MAGFPLYKQHDQMDCGPTCLRMIAKHYGRNFQLHVLRQKSFLTREGVSLLGISEAAEAIGFRTVGVTREQYCQDNAMIMRSCFNRGDTTCIENAGAAWEIHCQPYGL